MIPRTPPSTNRQQQHTQRPYINGNSAHYSPRYNPLQPQSRLSMDCDEAESIRRRKEYAVYPIIPKREITLIGGSPKVGTTTLLTMMCDCYRSGKSVLGFPSYSTPGCASLLCLTHSKGVVQRIAAQMGVLTAELNLTVMGIEANERERDRNTLAMIVKRLKKSNPALEVLFLDGYHRLFRGNRKDYDAGADGTDSVQEVLEAENLTLVAVGRSVKLNAENMEASPMERFYGSVSTTERIATFISMERLHHTSRDNPKRIITVETQGKPSIQSWEFTNTGLLVPESEATSENRVHEAFESFETMVMARGEGEAMTSEEMNELGEYLGISKATVARYRNRMIEQGMLEGGYGEYRVRSERGE